MAMELSSRRAEYERLKGDRTGIEVVWKIIDRLIMPYRNNFEWNKESGENGFNWQIGRDIYDSTAPISAQGLASAMHFSITSPAIQWFTPEWQTPELRKNKVAVEWLENAGRITYEELQASNFELEAAEMYLDLVGYGTGVVSEEVLDEDEGTIDFQSIPLDQCFFVIGANGDVIRFYRRYHWTATQIRDKFGDSTPDKYVKLDELGNSKERFEVVITYFVRNDKQDTAFPAVAIERPVGSIYFLADSGDTIGEEGGFWEMPIFAPRWRKTNGSQWGNCPAMLALPDVMTINSLEHLILKALEKVVDPATLATERALLSDLDLTPGGLTIVRDLNGLKPHESAARFDVSEMKSADIKESIKNIFFVNQLELKNSPQMTATEVQIRYELMQRLLGPTAARLKVDFLDKVVTRTFNVKFRAGKFGDLPAGVTSADIFKIEYTSPFARAQKMTAARSVMEYMSFLSQIAEVQSAAGMTDTVMDIPDFDQIARDLASMTSVPSAYVQDEKEVKRVRTDRQKQVEAAQQQAAQESAAKSNLDNSKAQSQAETPQ